MKEEVKYIVEPNEDECIAIRVKSTILYAYPINLKLLEVHPKVVTKTGELVKRVEIAIKDGVKVLIGELNEERLVWDIDGHFIQDGVENSEKNLYVFERYWDTQWRNRIKLSNGEWCIRYQRPHPNVQIPEEWTNRKYKVID